MNASAATPVRADVDMKSLKIFCDVVDRRSFSRAAKDNGMSQSTVSSIVQGLEERLGVLLLNRSTRPFDLTPEGERYYDGCRQIVKRHAELVEEVRTLRDAEAQRLVVASIYSVGMHHMSAFMRRFSAEHPRAQVRLEYLHPDRVCEEVEKGDANLGLVSYAEETSTLAVRPWRSESLTIVCRPDHPLAKRKSAPLGALVGEPFVAFEAGLAMRTAIDAALARTEVTPNVILEFDNIETMKRALEAEPSVSILPEPYVRREIALGTLTTVAIEGTTLSRPLAIIHRRDRSLGRLAEQFVGLLQADADFSLDAEPAALGSWPAARQPSAAAAKH